MLQYHMVTLLTFCILINHSQSKSNLDNDFVSERHHNGNRRSLAADYTSDNYYYDEYYDYYEEVYDEMYDLMYDNDYDDRLLDEFIDDLSLDELLDYYYLLNNNDYRFEKRMDFESDFFDGGETTNSQPTTTTTFSFSDPNPWPKNIKPPKSEKCHGDIGVMRGNQIFTPKQTQIKVMGQVRKPYRGTQYTFETGKEYKFKGLAWKSTDGNCDNPPSKITDYVLRFVNPPMGASTTHYISPKDLEQSIEEPPPRGVTLKENGQSTYKTIPPTQPIMPQQANKKCLSLAGGGIRAAMGAYFVMRKLETEHKLGKIECISVISGGAWGFVLWLFDHTATEDAGQAARNIEKFLGANKKGFSWFRSKNEWGPSVRAPGFAWWSKSLGKHILKMTSLKNKLQGGITFKNVGKKLQERIPGATLYFVVESIEVSYAAEYGKFMDYCWFKSSPSADEFICSKDNQPHNMDNAKVKPCGTTVNECTEEARDIQFIDILNYCSAAWATNNPWLKISRAVIGTTGLFVINEKKWRLVDAGETFNDPLLPYLVDDRYKRTKDFEIWNFDFYGYNAPAEIKRALKDSIVKIGKYKGQELTCKRGPTILGGMSIWEYDGYIINYFPLYGTHLKNKMMNKFPTQVAGVAKKWNLGEFNDFKNEWTGHLETIDWNRF